MRLRKKLKVLEMKCLRTIAGVRWSDRVRNNKGEITRVLEWSDHMEGMREKKDQENV